MTLEDKGFLYRGYDPKSDKFKTYWYDYKIKDKIEYCSKANCSHNSQECFAVQSQSSIKFLYNNELYYTKMEEKIKQNGETDTYTALYKSNVGGRGFKKITEVEGKAWLNRAVYLKDQNLYMVGIIEEMKRDEEGFGTRTGRTKAVLYDIDIGSGNMKSYVIREGWDCFSYICGYFDSNVYLYVTWYDTQYNIDQYLQEKTGDKDLTSKELLIKDESYLKLMMSEYAETLGGE